MWEYFWEALFFFVATVVFPVVINKTTDSGYLDWLKPYLRHTWTGILVFFSAYMLSKPYTIEVAMNLHRHLPGFAGYIVASLFGMLLLCFYWWITGNLLNKQQVHQEQVTSSTIATPQPVQPAPTFGNLKERALTLSQEIMHNLYLFGWRQNDPRAKADLGLNPPMSPMPPPTDVELTQKWIVGRTGYFRFAFFRRLVVIRDDFAKLFIRDEHIDQFIQYEESQSPPPFILPQELEMVADRLRIMANRLN